tara:strand:- start:14459 stop:14878 length:420 start_codon:yes stop_codon:yes gene_type:complete
MMLTKSIRRAQGGVTLIELMVVIAIVAILVGVALPAYQNQVLRGHRTAAKTEMLDIANRQQQFLLSDRAYASKAELVASGYTLPADVAARYSWDISVDNTGVPTFTISFTPQGAQVEDGAAALTLDSEGVRAPADKWER